MSLGVPSSEIESRQVLPSPLLKFGDTFEDLHDHYTDHITNCESPKSTSEHFGPSQVGKARWCLNEEGRSAEWNHSPIFAPSSTDRLTSQPLPTTCLRPFPAAVPVQIHCMSPPTVVRCRLRHRPIIQTSRRTLSVLLLAHLRARPQSPTPYQPGVTTCVWPISGRDLGSPTCRASPTAVAARCTRTFSRRSRRSQFPPPGVSPFSVGLSLPPGAISVADTDHTDLQENTVSAPFPAQPHLSPEFGSPPGATSVAVGRYTYPRA